MDRRRWPTRALALVVASLGTLAAARAADVALSPPLRAMRWIAPATNAAVALTRAPHECVREPKTPNEALLVEVGRATFRTPVVLGGQAARAGLSCDSCHRNGRGNPDFRFPGVSGAPGTADVTSSLFSSHRGNGVDDPKPIPDLGGPKAALKVSWAIATLTNVDGNRNDLCSGLLGYPANCHRGVKAAAVGEYYALRHDVLLFLAPPSALVGNAVPDRSARRNSRAHNSSAASVVRITTKTVSSPATVPTMSEAPDLSKVPAR